MDYSQIPSEMRRGIAAEALASQKSVLAFPYYSTARFNAARTGAGPYAYTMASGTRKTFNYRIGESPGASAGFATGVQVGKAETNLLKASETRDNADVMVWGVAIEARPGSDPYFVKQLWANAYVELSLSGTDAHLLGPLTFFPQAGGLYGMAASLVETPDLQAPKARPDGVLSNGNPTAGNFFKLPQPVRWESGGSGKKDTSLVIAITIDNAIALAGVADRAAAASVSGSPGQAAFVSPADGSIFVDLRVRLISISISERSTNT